jgi:putative endonuclease
MKTAGGRRHFTYLRGRGAERTALVWLMLKGYRPLASRFSAAGGEIDLIMRRGGTVEVALTAIDATKRRRFARAAGAWLARHPWAAGLTLRADAVFIAPGHWPRHLPNAFEIRIG